MPFDPALPAANSNLESAVIRNQLIALHTDLQTRATQAALNAGIGGTSANSNGVATLDSEFGDPDAEALRQKLNELINALRR